MWKGCLFLLAFLAAVAYFEWKFVDQFDLPNPILLTLILALGVTIVAGSVWGLADAVRKSAGPSGDPNTWRDGQQVRLSGVLRPQGQTLKAPFSLQEVLFYEYRAFQAQQIGSESAHRFPATFRGIHQAPCALETQSSLVLLSGFPFLKHFREDAFSGEPALVEAARLLASVNWRLSDRVHPDFEQYEQLLSNTSGQLPLHVINDRARESLLSPNGEPTAGRWQGGPQPALDGEAAERAIRQRLSRRAWSFRERVIPPGAEVTVDGTYRSSPPRIEIQRSIHSPSHTIRPGLSARVAAAEIWTASVFLIGFATLTGIAHYAVYAEGGAWYRDLLGWLKEFA